MSKSLPTSLSLPAGTPAEGKAEHLLCLNAAEGMLQLLIARRESSGPSPFTLLCSESWHAPSQGAELLAPALADALTRLGLAARDIRRIACVRGPGSFTGLRLVLATAAGLSRATGAEQAGIDYLSLLAHSACRRLGGFPDPEGESGTERLLWVLTYARKNLIHMQGFSVRASRHIGTPGGFVAPAPFTDVLVCPPQEAVLLIRAHLDEHRTDGRLARPVLLGSGLSRNYAVLDAAFVADKESAPASGEHLSAPLLLPPDFDHPLPEAILDVAASLCYAAGDVDPLYIRPADAEENLERIALSLGLDPAKAREKLAAITRSAG